ncbi:hypothetical protein GWI33_007076 [Rhynchophorus ferrugineus]|uniref:Uncharacterized protein n=1 Tax=Rhynchophorus ferrugineus TaxID=354439 RepID=A0A834IGC4_RHYFE|nr:hypothetical protein GWI33_007076 [Rhynchophorus ferrugineus]
MQTNTVMLFAEENGCRFGLSYPPPGAEYQIHILQNQVTQLIDRIKTGETDYEYEENKPPKVRKKGPLKKGA